MENEIDDTNILNGEEITPESETEVGLPADPIEVEPQDEELAVDSEALRESRRREQALYEQLKKAKGFKRDPKTGKWVKPEPKPEAKVEGTGDITKTELFSLVKANVADEDVNEVVLYARSHQMSVTEALKLPEVKAILRTKQDLRKSAEASNTGSVRRGSSKLTADDILDNARKGVLPSVNDDAGWEALAKARIEKKKADLKR